MNHVVSIQFFAIVIVIFLGFSYANAVTELSTNGNLASDVTPEHPEPGEEVEISLQGYGFNIDQSTIIWRINGENQPLARNNKSFSTNVGELGSETIIDAIIQTNTGSFASKRFIFNPGDIDLLIESNSYTPPFYSGAPLPSSDTEVTITAIPHFITSNEQELTVNEIDFSWEKDGSRFSSKSGRGKDSATFNTGRFPSDFTVSVRAQSGIQPNNGRISAEKEVTVPVFDPEIIFYEVKPLIGPDYTNALSGQFSLQESEATLKVEPYFISRNKTNSNLLDFTWLVNGERSDQSGLDSDTILIAGTESSGTNSLTVVIDYIESTLQQFEESISIQLNAPASSF